MSVDAHKADVYNALKLYESLLKLCFSVVNRTVVSSEADNLFVYLGLRETLEELLKQIDPLVTPALPASLLPKSISGMSNEAYQVLQGGFGTIKTYAKEINAHDSKLTAEVQSFINDTEEVLRGGTIVSDILLSESEISTYNQATKSLTINQKRIVFDGAQEDYFMWAMFKQNRGEIVSWDVIPDEVANEFNDSQVFSQGWYSVNQTMHRVNRKIMKNVGTKDKFFDHKRRGFIRNYGPNPE